MDANLSATGVQEATDSLVREAMQPCLFRPEWKDVKMPIVLCESKIDLGSGDYASVQEQSNGRVWCYLTVGNFGGGVSCEGDLEVGKQRFCELLIPKIETMVERIKQLEPTP